MGKSAQIEAVERLVRESVATVDALAPEALRALLPALRQARDELRGDLYSWLSRGQGQEDRFTAYERAKALRAIEGSLARVEELEPAMASALAVGRHAVGPLAVANLGTEVQRLSSIFGGGIPTIPNIQAAAVIAQGDRLLWRRHKVSAARYAGGIGDDIKHQLAVAVAKGETFAQMTRRLAGNAAFRSTVAASDPGAAAAMISDGMFHKWRHWGDRLVRTENMHAYNTLHDVSIEHANENRAEGEDEYLRRWDASADKVTCPRCKELHETTATIDGTFKWGVKAPPLHPYCRCVVLAWLERWGNMRGETKARHKYGGIMEPREPTPKPKADKAPASSLPQEGKRARVKRNPVIEPTAPPKERKNAKRVAAAKVAAEASAERVREIHSAAKSNLPKELHVAWDAEGHKFMREEAGRIKGVKDRVNASSTLSQAFAEKYGSGAETMQGNEGDRFFKRAEIEAKHAESWADEQERKYYAAAQREADDGRGRSRSTPQQWEPPKAKDDDDPPF